MSCKIRDRAAHGVLSAMSVIALARCSHRDIEVVWPFHSCYCLTFLILLDQEMKARCVRRWSALMNETAVHYALDDVVWSQQLDTGCSLEKSSRLHHVEAQVQDPGCKTVAAWRFRRKAAEIKPFATLAGSGNACG
ncbi:uncharacterized protein BO72DRAFT_293047 [Aspergillus fijiensis CBS 313.89]|uniref:Uncharacterized protein n=1 Tax=Aspergillus fijiensis CBS 313.89 TaxID=1448319 RepID=A0A8G1REZ2_9EURO|nr:uncharacterized protein BO72DRAFT_293047 [Aspergillus fijiensis CBS 313.89]RAK72065.1 hypothetical protein BO72DRAFT_293047 [Aspergillus fijiensis CBS 313.89]